MDRTRTSFIEDGGLDNDFSIYQFFGTSRFWPRLIVSLFLLFHLSTASTFSNPENFSNAHVHAYLKVELLLSVSDLVFQVIRRSLLLHQFRRRLFETTESGLPSGGTTNPPRFLVDFWIPRTAGYKYGWTI